MNNNTITIQTPLTPKEVVDKLKSITVTDFAQLLNEPPVSYYGEITFHSFNIKNIRYSPYSAVPLLKGEIQERGKETIVKLNMDIREYYLITRKMYYSTLLAIGIIIMLLSALFLGGTEYQLQGFLFSGLFIICALAVVALSKVLLTGIKKKEIKEFASTINGSIVPEK